MERDTIKPTRSGLHRLRVAILASAGIALLVAPFLKLYLSGSDLTLSIALDPAHFGAVSWPWPGGPAEWLIEYGVVVSLIFSFVPFMIRKFGRMASSDQVTTSDTERPPLRVVETVFVAIVSAGIIIPLARFVYQFTAGDDDRIDALLAFVCLVIILFVGNTLRRIPLMRTLIQFFDPEADLD